MKKLNCTVTLCLLDEDNDQRILFRIFPLATKDGLIFSDRKKSYPDYGSLRIIPDKREQSSFKDRMRSMGKLCCTQLYTEGKEITKIRQNRNYDPNQDEHNQYAVYSDIVCGFMPDAVFEVFQPNQDFTKSLTNTILVQKGPVLYGPIHNTDEVQWDTIKPFGNEKYLLQSTEDPNGGSHIFYWNPEAIVTWRQRKRALKEKAELARKAELEASKAMEIKQSVAKEIDQPNMQETTPMHIPIGEKLTILDDAQTNEEQISALNQPVSNLANKLGSDTATNETHNQEPIEQNYQSTPMVETSHRSHYSKSSIRNMYSFVQKQIHSKKETPADSKQSSNNHNTIQNPVDAFQKSLEDVWSIPSLQDQVVSMISNNPALIRAIANIHHRDLQSHPIYAAARTELDEIEAERLALLVELDKVKTDYQRAKEKVFTDLSEKKQAELAKLDYSIYTMKEEKMQLEEALFQLSNQVQSTCTKDITKHQTMLKTSNGTETILSPTMGYSFTTHELVESIRSTMNAQGFMCKQDCMTEFMIHLSISDEIAVLADTYWEAELYVKSILRALGLLNVTVWPNEYEVLHVTSFLPENEYRTPTIEVIQDNNRSPIKAYGHKAIHLIDQSHLASMQAMPVIRVPKLNKEHGQEKINENGKPISLETLHSFSAKATPLYKDGEVWFDDLESKLIAQNTLVPENTLFAMRTFARIAAPQLIGGYMEAVDAAVLAWIIPILIRQDIQKEHSVPLIGNLPRSMRFIP